MVHVNSFRAVFVHVNAKGVVSVNIADSQNAAGVSKVPINTHNPFINRGSSQVSFVAALLRSQRDTVTTKTFYQTKAFSTTPTTTAVSNNRLPALSIRKAPTQWPFTIKEPGQSSSTYGPL